MSLLKLVKNKILSLFQKRRDRIIQKKLIRNLIKNQKDIPSDFKKVIDNKFWDMLT